MRICAVVILMLVSGCITANTNKQLDLIPDGITAEYSRYDEFRTGDFGLSGVSFGLYWSIAEPTEPTEYEYEGYVEEDVNYEQFKKR